MHGEQPRQTQGRPPWLRPCRGHAHPEPRLQGTFSVQAKPRIKSWMRTRRHINDRGFGDWYDKNEAEGRFENWAFEAGDAEHGNGLRRPSRLTRARCTGTRGATRPRATQLGLVDDVFQEKLTTGCGDGTTAPRSRCRTREPTIISNLNKRAPIRRRGHRLQARRRTMARPRPVGDHHPVRVFSGFVTPPATRTASKTNPTGAWTASRINIKGNTRRSCSSRSGTATATATATTSAATAVPCDADKFDFTLYVLD